MLSSRGEGGCKLTLRFHIAFCYLVMSYWFSDNTCLLCTALCWSVSLWVLVAWLVTQPTSASGADRDHFHTKKVTFQEAKWNSHVVPDMFPLDTVQGIGKHVTSLWSGSYIEAESLSASDHTSINLPCFWLACYQTHLHWCYRIKPYSTHNVSITILMACTPDRSYLAIGIFLYCWVFNKLFGSKCYLRIVLNQE